MGYSAASYAETTGIALLALDSVETSTLNAAEQMLSDCAAFSASTWLRLGLLAHGRRCPSTEPAFRPIVADAALAEIARCATEGKNVLRP